MEAAVWGQQLQPSPAHLLGQLGQGGHGRGSKPQQVKKEDKKKRKKKIYEIRRRKRNRCQFFGFALETPCGSSVLLQCGYVSGLCSLVILLVFILFLFSNTVRVPFSKRLRVTNGGLKITYTVHTYIGSKEFVEWNKNQENFHPVK
jgi:hypothetical protein